MSSSSLPILTAADALGLTLVALRLGVVATAVFVVRGAKQVSKQQFVMLSCALLLAQAASFRDLLSKPLVQDAVEAGKGVHRMLGGLEGVSGSGIGLATGLMTHPRVHRMLACVLGLGGALSVGVHGWLHARGVSKPWGGLMVVLAVGVGVLVGGWSVMLGMDIVKKLGHEKLHHYLTQPLILDCSVALLEAVGLAMSLTIAKQLQDQTMVIPKKKKTTTEDVEEKGKEGKEEKEGKKGKKGKKGKEGKEGKEEKKGKGGGAVLGSGGSEANGKEGVAEEEEVIEFAVENAWWLSAIIEAYFGARCFLATWWLVQGQHSGGRMLAMIALRGPDPLCHTADVMVYLVASVGNALGLLLASLLTSRVSVTFLLAGASLGILAAAGTTTVIRSTLKLPPNHPSTLYHLGVTTSPQPTPSSTFQLPITPQAIGRGFLLGFDVAMALLASVGGGGMGMIAHAAIVQAVFYLHKITF